VYLCVCEFVCAYLRERGGVCVCTCVSKSERERKGVCVRVCVYMSTCVYCILTNEHMHTHKFSLHLRICKLSNTRALTISRRVFAKTKTSTKAAVETLSHNHEKQKTRKACSWIEDCGEIIWNRSAVDLPSLRPVKSERKRCREDAREKCVILAVVLRNVYASEHQATDSSPSSHLRLLPVAENALCTFDLSASVKATQDKTLPWTCLASHDTSNLVF